MRTVLRRRIMEASPGDNWTDTVLNDVLNVALADTQKDVMEVDPLAFVNIAQQSLTAGLEFYAKPAGMWYELQVQRLNSAGTRYDDLERRDYVVGRAADTESGTSTYALLGRHIAIHPIPSASVTNGLQIIYVPTLAMSDDADVPEIHLGLHMLIVLRAHRLLSGETGESVAEVKDLTEEYRAAIPSFYKASGTNFVFRPDIVKNYLDPL